jgi:hypothetical protein
MALAAQQRRGGFCQGRGGAAERSEQSGEPLQVPTAYAKKPPEAGALKREISYDYQGSY